MDSRGTAITATGLRKRFGPKNALDGFDLEVRQGTVRGLLGPNGAGKTTAVRILSTLLRLDAGSAVVAGYDVATQAAQVRYRIGLVGQYPAVDEELSARQNLVLFGRLFHLPTRAARRRADELLEAFGLTEPGERPAKTFSGGMRRRLDLAAGMILSPAVLFLDEPTTGLDPRGRSEVWEAVRGLVRSGTTVLLTTQYLDEADQLADQISVIDRGQVIAEGTPNQLKGQLGGDRLDLVVHDEADLGAAGVALAPVLGSELEIDRDSRRLSGQIRGQGGVALTEAVRALDSAGVLAEDIALRRPTLDEVFLHLTGRRPDLAGDGDGRAGKGAAPAKRGRRTKDGDGDRGVPPSRRAEDVEGASA